MRAKCAMYGCKNATYNEFGYLLTFHRFPKNPERLLKWKEICKNPRITNIHHRCLFLCSHHFDKSSFNNQLLKPHAVPNRNLPKEEAVLPFPAIAQENNRMGDSGTDASDDTAAKVTVKRELISEEIEQGDSSEGEESDSSKLLEASGDESNDSSKASHSWHQNATRSISIGTPKISDPLITSISSLAQTSKVRTISDEEIDDCSTFAEFVKSRMRKFDCVQKTIAQKLISDILFMADTNQLQLGSMVMTPQAIPLRTATTQGATATHVIVPKVNSQQSGSLSVYVSDDDSDDDSPLSKRKK